MDWIDGHPRVNMISKGADEETSPSRRWIGTYIIHEVRRRHDSNIGRGCQIPCLRRVFHDNQCGNRTIDWLLLLEDSTMNFYQYIDEKFNNFIGPGTSCRYVCLQLWSHNWTLIIQSRRVALCLSNKFTRICVISHRHVLDLPLNPAPCASCMPPTSIASTAYSFQNLCKTQH